MEFKINNIKKGISDIIRTVGYHTTYLQNDKDISVVRLLTRSDYPRFHLYIKKEESGGLNFSLHLDQKKPSYRGSHAHSGEYDGQLVESEAERIKSLVL